MPAPARVCIKHPANPILTAADIPGPVQFVLNPGAIRHRGEYILMLDAATLAEPIVFWLARSRDGVRFTADPAPVAWPAPDPIHPEDCVYDPRITLIDGVYHICYASSGPHGVRIGLVTTTDFATFTRVGTISDQNNRNGVLFPERIGGRYVRLDRPMGDPHRDTAGAWISYSPDLIHWGGSRPLLGARPGLWDGQKVGGGAVPIRTDKGWLELYHGVSKTCNGFIYRLGVCLLDLADPARVIARGEQAVLWPEHPYERAGRVDNVVFACNALLDDDGSTVRIYYGAADACIGLATARLGDLVDACFARCPLRLRL